MTLPHSVYLPRAVKNSVIVRFHKSHIRPLVTSFRPREAIISFDRFSRYPVFHSFHRYGPLVKMVSIRGAHVPCRWGRKCESPREGAFAHDERGSSGAIGSRLSRFWGSARPPQRACTQAGGSASIPDPPRRCLRRFHQLPDGVEHHLELPVILPFHIIQTPEYVTMGGGQLP